MNRIVEPISQTDIDLPSRSRTEGGMITEGKKRVCISSFIGMKSYQSFEDINVSKNKM